MAEDGDVAQDPRALHQAIGEVEAVHVLPGGMVNDRPMASVPVLVVDARADIDELLHLLEVSTVGGFRCMCAGGPTLRFVGRGGSTVAVAAVHHAFALRWSGWSSDADLARGRALVDWMAGKGYPDPLQEIEAA